MPRVLLSRRAILRSVSGFDTGLCTLPGEIQANFRQEIPSCQTSNDPMPRTKISSPTSIVGSAMQALQVIRKRT